MELTSYKNIWKVTYPIIVGSIAENIINVVDTAFLGQLGPIALGAAGNSIIYYFVFIVIGEGLAVGGEIIVGRRNGEETGDERRKRQQAEQQAMSQQKKLSYIQMARLGYQELVNAIIRPPRADYKVR